MLGFKGSRIRVNDIFLPLDPLIPRILEPFFVCINVSIFSDEFLIKILDLLEIICDTIFREVSEVFVVSSSKDSGLCSFPIT
jgi:hypothetical protein